MHGSIFGEFENVRTVNVNLRTGEVYSFDDVLHMTDGIANQFVSTPGAQQWRLHPLHLRTRENRCHAGR